jgi:hypothetical protein
LGLSKIEQHEDEEHPERVAAGAREMDAYDTFWRTMPTTHAGFAAYFHYLQQPHGPVDAKIKNRPAAIIENSDGPHVIRWAMMMEWAHRRLAMVPPGTAIDINISASARTAPGQGLLPLHGHRRTAISLLAGTSYSAAALSIVSRLPSP